MSSRYECQSAFLIIDSHQIDFFVVQIILACHLLPAVAIAKVMLQKRVCFVVWIQTRGFCPLIVLEFPAWWFVCNVLTSFGCPSVNCYFHN